MSPHVLPDGIVGASGWQHKVVTRWETHTPISHNIKSTDIFSAVLCWETLDPHIYVDVNLHNSYADQAQAP